MFYTDDEIKIPWAQYSSIMTSGSMLCLKECGLLPSVG